MAYWVYNMGLPIAVKHDILVQKKNIKAIESVKGEKRILDTDHPISSNVKLDKNANISKAKQIKLNTAYTSYTAKEPESLVYASELMSTTIETLPVSTRFSDAWHIFQQKRFRHFPVVNESNKLIGIISDRDMITSALFTKSETGLHHPNPTIADTMIRKVITASKDTDIHEICQVMLSQHIGAVPIMGENGDIEGIVTRSDILRVLIKHPAMSLWA